MRDQDWRNDTTLFTAAVARNPNDADLRANLGLIYWNGHQQDAGIQEWKTGVAHNPDGVWALNNLAMAYIEQEKYKDAMPLLSHAIELRPKFTYAHLNMGAALAGLGDTSAAEPEFREAVTDSPLDWYVRNRFGEFLLKAGRTDDAKAQYQFSINTVVNQEALDKLGDIAIERGDSNLAESYFRQAADLESFDAHAHFRLAIIYGNSGRSAEAVREYQLALKTDPGADELGQEAKTVIDRLQKK